MGILTKSSHTETCLIFLLSTGKMKTRSCTNLGKRRILGELPCDPDQIPGDRTITAKKALAFDKDTTEDQGSLHYSHDNTPLLTMLRDIKESSCLSIVLQAMLKDFVCLMLRNILGIILGVFCLANNAEGYLRFILSVYCLGNAIRPKPFNRFK